MVGVILAEHPLVSLVFAAVLTLVGKYVWDRWLSKSSRVSEDLCDERRTTCRQALMTELASQKVASKAQFDCGEETMDITSHTLTVVLLTLLKMCNKMDIDCAELTKAMVERGLMA